MKCHSCRTQRWSDKLQRKKNGQKGSKVKSQNDGERWGESHLTAFTTQAPYVEKWWLTTQAWQNPTPAPPVGEGKGAEWIIGCDSNCNGYIGNCSIQPDLYNMLWVLFLNYNNTIIYIERL